MKKAVLLLCLLAFSHSLMAAGRNPLPNVDLSGSSQVINGTLISGSGGSINADTLNGLSASQFQLKVGAPYSAGVLGTLDRANGELQAATVSTSGTLSAPLNGSAGLQLTAWITVSGSTNRSLGFSSSIKIPSDSYLTLPKTLTAGKLYIVKLWHDGTNWMLISLEGGF